MAKFIVKGTVKYQGKTYTHGSTVEVADKDVAEFKKYGWEMVGKAEAQKAEGEEQDLSKLKVVQLQALLTEKGIEYPADAKKAQLIALLG